MVLLAEGFFRRFSDPSMRSRTALAAPSLARGFQYRPHLPQNVRLLMNDARAFWLGGTLAGYTTNYTSPTPFRATLLRHAARP